jgi:hypothetical protein
MAEVSERTIGLQHRREPPLRPRWTTTAAVTDFVDTQLRPMGYRLMAHSSVLGKGRLQSWASGSCGQQHGVITCTSMM